MVPPSAMESGGSSAMASRMRVVTSDRKSTRLNSSHLVISYAVFCFGTDEHTALLYLYYNVLSWRVPVAGARYSIERKARTHDPPLFSGAVLLSLCFFFNHKAPAQPPPSSPTPPPPA